MDPIELIRPEVRALQAYHVQDARGLIKLDAMENPFPLPAGLRDLLGQRLAEAAYNRYPDAQPAALKALLAASLGVPAAAGLLLGNGSDEVIQILAQAVARPGATLLSVEPGFVMFRLLAQSCGLNYHGVPLRADFSLDLDAVLDAIRVIRPALVFLAIPNNPTGNVFPDAAVAAVLEATPGLVVVDEAYFPFTDHSWLARVGERRNLLVMRTLSKLGLAGIRLGFLAGPPDLIGEFEKLRLPYNISVATQVIATTVLESVDVLWQQARLLRAERSRMAGVLAAMAGVQCFASEANFLLIRVDQPGAVFDALKAHGILIKNLNGAHALLHGCLRITVGSSDQNDRLLDALAVSLRAPG
ncbi:MAG: histidinol-phosphate transaminase [Pseudomonadota bacterium]|nr:histidinol-phosphate transaminase [Pseudomonadota bacterium]